MNPHLNDPVYIETQLVKLLDGFIKGFVDVEKG